MMTLCSHSHAPRFIAAFTERVCGHIFVSDPLPFTSVFLFHIRGTLVFVVLLPGQCAVLLAVGLLGQFRTTGVSTGALWFLWHGSHPLSVEELPQLKADHVPYLFSVGYFSVGHCLPPGMAKAPADCSVEARSVFLSIVILSQEATIFLYILLSYIARLSNPLRARSCSLYV